MTLVLGSLHDDHDNTRVLLNVIEHQCECVAAGGDLDHELMEDVVEYCLAYPSLYHHPKEDAIYALMRQRAPGVAQQFDGLQEQHRELKQLTQRMGDTVRGLAADGFLPRDQVVAELRAFVDFYRRHVRWEDTVFFPAAQRCLGEADWKQLDQEFGPATDPLFGTATRDQYIAIRKAIQSAAAD